MLALLDPVSQPSFCKLTVEGILADNARLANGIEQWRKAEALVDLVILRANLNEAEDLSWGEMLDVPTEIPGYSVGLVE